MTAADRQLQLIAHTAARLMAEDGIADFTAAKRKAVQMLGLTDKAKLPGNAEVEAELRAYQRIFQNDEQQQRIGRLHDLALGELALDDHAAHGGDDRGHRIDFTLLAQALDGSRADAEQLQLVGGGACFSLGNLVFAFPALQFGGTDHVGLEQRLGPFGITPVEFKLGPGFQVRQLLLGEFAAVQAGQHGPLFDILPQPGVDLDQGVVPDVSPDMAMSDQALAGVGP